MAKLNPSITPSVVGVCGKLIVFKLDRNEYALATKRVANDVLAGSKDISYEERLEFPVHLPKHLCMTEWGSVEPRTCCTYLATPSIW